MLTITCKKFYYNITKTISLKEAYLGDTQADIADMRFISFYSVESDERTAGCEPGHGRTHQTGGA
jgi:hypothetical protein